MTLTVSVWVRKAEDSGRGGLLEKCVRGSRSGETGARNEQKKGMAVEGGARDPSMNLRSEKSVV